MLTEISPVAGTALPVEELAVQLRLSRGFVDDGALDAHLATCLRSALAAIEARTSKALFRRTFSLSVTSWTTTESQMLPIAPIASLESVKVISRTGEETPIDLERFGLVPDAHRPAMFALSGRLPDLSPFGFAEIRFGAGYSTDWEGLPPDLKQAVLLLAGELFGQDIETQSNFPAAVAVLLEPFRSLKLHGAVR